MKLLTIVVLAEMAWLALAVSGSQFGFLAGFVGFVVTPAILIEYHERARGLAQRVEYSDVAQEVSRG